MKLHHHNHYLQNFPSNSPKGRLSSESQSSSLLLIFIDGHNFFQEPLCAIFRQKIKANKDEEKKKKREAGKELYLLQSYKTLRIYI